LRLSFFCASSPLPEPHWPQTLRPGSEHCLTDALRKDMPMTQFANDPQDTETSSHDIIDRLAELAGQCWSRGKSLALAKTEGLDLNDEHWAVVVFLRKYYLQYGLPINARVTARALTEKFAVQGGNKYLHRLFAGGPVTQGSRIANLRIPAYATDPSFGTSY
jgi:tRNA 2-thiouridine synthesizing protein E